MSSDERDNDQKTSVFFKKRSWMTLQNEVHLLSFKTGFKFLSFNLEDSAYSQVK